MVGFEVLKDIDDGSLEKLPVSAFSGTKGGLIERTAGSTTWQACTSTSAHFTPKAILMETVVSASSVLAYRLTGGETVKVASTNVSAVADNGDRMTLTDYLTMNNTGTDVTGEAVSFIQEGTVGTAAEKVLVGRVLVGNGVDPDAA